MKNKFLLPFILLLASTAILSACGPLTAKAQDGPTNEAVEVINVEPETETDLPEEAQPVNDTEAASIQQVSGWLGAVFSLPEDSQHDDYLMLSPEGTGELGLTGASDEIEEQIIALRGNRDEGISHHAGKLCHAKV